MARSPQAKSSPLDPPKGTKPTDEPDSDLLVSFNAGDTILREGDRGDEMYIIERGEVDLVKRFGPRERHLATLGVGDFFGEISVLEEIPRTATARARTDCRLLPIDPSTFDHLLREHPEVTVRMLRKLTRRLREIDEETERAHAAAAGVLAGVERGPMEPIDPTVPWNEESSARLATSDAVPPEPPPELSEQTVAHLVHAASGTSYPVAPDGKSVIGRFDPVTGKHPEIDLEPIDGRRSLSRRHARIWSDRGRFFVREEVGVGNGTYLRGRRIAAGEDHEVLDGDAVRLGLVELVFRAGPESQ